MRRREFEGAVVGARNEQPGRRIQFLDKPECFFGALRGDPAGRGRAARGRPEGKAFPKSI